jgi:hypothetical protein
MTSGFEVWNTPGNIIGYPGSSMRHRATGHSGYLGHARNGSDTSVYGGFSPSPPSISPTPADQLSEGEMEGEGRPPNVPASVAAWPVSMPVHRTAELPDVPKEEGVEGGDEALLSYSGPQSELSVTTSPVPAQQNASIEQPTTLEIPVLVSRETIQERRDDNQQST